MSSSVGALGREVARPPTARKLTVVVADRSPMFLSGLRMAIESEPDLAIVGEAADAVTALRLALETRPDVLLLELALEEAAGLDVLTQLGGPHAEVKTLLLAPHFDAAEAIANIRLGARGILTKDSSAQISVKSIRTVAGGGYWFGRDTVMALVRALVHAEPTARGGPGGLTRREMDILSLVLKGFSNKDIASERAIAEDTVKRHLTNIFDKTGVSNRLELALFAIHHHLFMEE